MYLKILTGHFCFFLSPQLIAQPAFDSACIVADHAVPKLISRQFAFTEGPAVDKNGNVFFTDQPNDKIWEYSSEGKLTLFINHSGRSNGLYVDSKGNLIACADNNNQLWSISPKKKIHVLVRDYKGKKLNGPNDLWIDHAGGIYFTDPYYQRSYWKRIKPDLDGEKVYYLPKGQNKPIVVVSDLEKPNGIVGSADGHFLFISDLQANKTFRYKISRPGKLSGKQLFVSQGSDGMVLDEKGDLYLSGNGITVYNSMGRRIAYIPVNEKWTGNLCFVGRQRNQLFITASQGIYLLAMRVKGIE